MEEDGEQGRRMQRRWCSPGLLEVGESGARAGSLGTVAYASTIIALQDDTVGSEHISLLPLCCNLVKA